VARAPLFEFLEAVHIALARRLLAPAQASVAGLIAVWSPGTNAEDATVDAARLAIELDVSERTIWRHVRALVDGGWMVQTEAPKRQTAPGERPATA
jgi:hypothetical protein